uniref:NADH-ubiquinone oxidoreductase chain 2 n=1 Tax=Paralithodes brevipes TaxID=174403 RepID=R4X5X5_PARBV|nr:NADH dehydrogenase subunit 2 [Paralithodes brevipes]BAN28992.1 NADH dehydrogenase subunit 2 [Paralithodes brevipes]
MFLSLSNMMFMSTLSLGMMMAISAPSWFMAWVGLELNLMSFIPIILTMNNRYSSEAALKYFLIQALGSSFIIFSSSLMLLSSEVSFFMIISALLLKLGAAPFHFWFPQIMEGLSWPRLIILMTIQKIAPLSLILLLMPYQQTYTVVIMSAVLSAIIGSIMGINQTSLRKIMAFSSINHMAWMLAAAILSENMMFMYFLFYCCISSSVALIFHNHQAFYISNLVDKKESSSVSNFPMFMALFSLGGLPPFTGFIPKWFIIQELNNFNMFMLFIVLLSCTLITLYFYLRVAIPFLTFSAPSFKSSLAYNLNNNNNLLSSPFIIFMNMFGLMIPSLFMIM